MKRISLIGKFAFNDAQLNRLKSIGTVTNHEVPDSSEGWSKISEESDVIISNGDGLLESIYSLKDVFVTYPFIELGNFDSKKLAENNVIIANTQGSNRDSIIEWIVYMTLSLFRKFPSMVRVKNDIPLEFNQSLVGKTALVVGKGSIGIKTGEVLKALGMNVDYFGRGDDLVQKGKEADLVVDCLNCNSTSENLLDEKFFSSMKPGSYFVTFARPFTYDIDGLIKAISAGIVAGAAIDCDPESPGDTANAFYNKALSAEKILVTPHIAFATEQAKRNGAETVIRNVEAYAAGKWINVVVKK
ncbi:MAG: NAD(P)-dependent oxidoreductase [Candidatus Woesearchaeota archaeon]